MSTTNLLLCAVLLFNTAAAAAYLIWGMPTARRTKKGKMLVFIRFFPVSYTHLTLPTT
mgnify:CR=1 FL=1